MGSLMVKGHDGTVDKASARKLALAEFVSARDILDGEAETDPECRRLAWQVVEENLPLLHWVLRKDKGHTETILPDYDEAASYLVETLYNAVWTYNPQLGTFATYATMCLRYQLIQYKTTMRIQQSPFSGPINGPNITQIITSMWQAIETERLTPEKATALAIARFEVAERSVAMRTGKYRRVYSYQLRDEDGFFTEEVSPMEGIVDTSDTTESADFALEEALETALSSLSDRERWVVELHFGLRENRSHTLEEMGREAGVTRARIYQIETKALRKLRHPTRARALAEFLW